MKYLYGYIEIRAKFAVHPATSTIWFSAEQDPVTRKGVEVDLVENINKSIDDNTTEFFSNIHLWTYGSTQSLSLDSKWQEKEDATYRTNPTVSLAEDFHTYGLMWTEKEYIFFVDGVEYYRYDIENGILSENGDSVNSFRKPMFIVMNIGMQNAAAEGETQYCPIWQDGDPTEAYYSVDYVRLYQKSTDNGSLIK